ncbi:MAG: HD domain-containing protein, partial [Deltaproteobacteria bacterium]
MRSLNRPGHDYGGPLRLCLSCLQQTKTPVSPEKILREAGIADPAGPVGFEAFRRFCQQGRQVVGDDMLRRAGRHAGSRRTRALSRNILLGMAGPEIVLRREIRRMLQGWPVDWQLQRTGERRLQLEVRDHGAQALLCPLITGMLEGMAPFYRFEQAGLLHTRCAERGDSSCRYGLSWQEQPADAVRRRRNVLAVGTAAALPALPLLTPLQTEIFCLTSLGGLLGLSTLAGLKERISTQAQLQEQIHINEELIDQENANALKIQLTRELGQAVESRTSREDLLQAIIDVLAENLDFDRGMMFLLNQGETSLLYKAGFGLSREELQGVKPPIDVEPGPRSHPLAAVLKRGEPLLVNDLRQLHAISHHAFCRWMTHLGSRAVLCCPIRTQNRPTGLLILDLRTPRRNLLESDLQLVEGLTPLIGIGLQNARLLLQQSSQFQSILQVLAASIDARDFLTAGHSAQVTEYAVGICRTMALSEEFTDVVRIAAMLHDYGKLAVPDFILKKAGELTAEEKALIRTHPDKSREILERIPFEGIYRQIPEIVGAHHEKMDGSGYPKGLKGEEIPLGARIIAVADFFEAITSKRHYREPMSFPAALQLLAEESLIHLDPQVVDAFIRYVNANKLCLVDTGAKSLPVHKKIPAGIDRRRVRIPCRTQVSCQAGNRVLAGTSANLSTGGIYVATDQ